MCPILSAACMHYGQCVQDCSCAHFILVYMFASLDTANKSKGKCVLFVCLFPFVLVVILNLFQTYILKEKLQKYPKYSYTSHPTSPILTSYITIV